MSGDLAAIIDWLAATDRLTRVRSTVDPVHELAGIAARLEGGPRAVLFENVRGSDVPVLTGLYWSRDLLAGLLDTDAGSLAHLVAGRIAAWQRAPVDPVVTDDGPVREVTADVDLTALPIPVHALGDGGPYIDAGVVIAHDPETGVRNASIQRFMVAGQDTLHINIDAGRHLELYRAKAPDRPLPISLNIGVPPGVHFAAAAPSEAAPADTDELGIASAFDGAPLELVRGKHSPVELVAHAMYGLECEILPDTVADEGPFAEVTGYYAHRAPRPVVAVRAIHHRAEPVFHTILSGKEVWNSVGLLGESNVLALVRRQVPGVLDVAFTHGGCGFYHAAVQMTPSRAGWSKQALLATFAAFPPLKMVTVVDEDVDIRDPADIEWAMATRLNPDTGVLRIPDAFGHGLNPSFPGYLGSKIGFDATRPMPRRPEHDRVRFQPVDLAAHELH